MKVSLTFHLCFFLGIFLTEPLVSQEAMMPIDGPFLMDNVLQIQEYSDYLIVSEPAQLQVFRKDLQLFWDISLLPDKYQIEDKAFDKLYITNKKNTVYVASLRSKLVDQPLFLPKFITLDSHFPYIVGQDVGAIFSAYHLGTESELWSKNLACDQVHLFAAAEFSGCQTAKSFYVYETLTGRLHYKTTAVNASWQFQSSHNQGAYFTRGNRLRFVDFKKKSHRTIPYKATEIARFLRQKEILRVDKEAGHIECIDLVSNKRRWEFKPRYTFSNVLTNSHAVMVAMPSQNYTVLDHFSGETLVTFKIDDAAFKPNLFYEHKGKWYVLGQSGVYMLEQKVL